MNVCGYSLMLCQALSGLPEAAQGSVLRNVGFESAEMPHGSEIRVTREPLCSGEINPFQYGQFVEYLCDLIPGMWSEKLYDGSFEGLSRYDVVFRKESDFHEKPWYPSGAVNRAQYTLDKENPVSGSVSERISASGAAPCTVGISQDGISVEPSVPCVFTCYLRQEGVKEPVRVQLHREGTILASCEFQPTNAWKKYRAQLAPASSNTHATLSIEFRGPGTLWLDNASLMPRDNVGGWRKDVVEAVRQLKPAIIRFGGSAVEYLDWHDSIGDPDQRKPFRAWGGLQPQGPGLEEIIQFCHTVGAEPLVCVRFAGRTPQDAAEQVQYFNGSTNTPMGALRAKNGHAEPYAIRFWQVGNEVRSAEYDAQLAGFCRAMKEADPTIRLMSSYPTATLVREARDLLDYVCPHHYGCRDLKAMSDSLGSIRKMLEDEAPGRPIKIAVTEWNTTGGDWGTGRAMLWTLENALACARYHNLLHRHSDIVQVANRSNLTNSFCSGIIQTDNHRLYRTPTYYAQQLYATLAGNRPLKLEGSGLAEAGLDISATLSPAGDKVVLFAVNDSLQEITRMLDLSAFGAEGQEAGIWTLRDRQHSGEPDVTNSYSDPERVTPIRSTFRAPSVRFDYSFPAISLTVIQWKVDPSNQTK